MNMSSMQMDYGPHPNQPSASYCLPVLFNLGTFNSLVIRPHDADNVLGRLVTAVLITFRPSIQSPPPPQAAEL